MTGHFALSRHSGHSSRVPLHGKHLLISNWWVAMGRGDTELGA
jgi:hypothetical protein